MDPRFVESLISAVLTICLSVQAYHAYRYTRKPYLLNFTAGFFLLSLSYFVLLPLALGYTLPDFSDKDDILGYPARAIIQSMGFILIALSYSQTARVKQLLLGLVGMLVVLVLLLISPQVYVSPSVDVYLYSINTLLLGYILFHMLKVMPPKDLVFAGFVLLALDQYTLLIGSVNESLNSTDQASLLLAPFIRLVAFSLLFVSFLLSQVRIPMRIAQNRNGVRESI